MGKVLQHYLHPMNAWSKVGGHCKPFFEFYEKYAWQTFLRDLFALGFKRYAIDLANRISETVIETGEISNIYPNGYSRVRRDDYSEGLGPSLDIEELKNIHGTGANEGRARSDVVGPRVSLAELREEIVPDHPTDYQGLKSISEEARSSEQI